MDKTDNSAQAPEPQTFVSVASELDEIRNAVQGVRLLSQILAGGDASEEHDPREVGRCSSAILSLIDCRLHLVRRAVRGYVAPGTLRAPHNEMSLYAPEQRVFHPCPDGDILLANGLAEAISELDKEVEEVRGDNDKAANGEKPSDDSDSGNGSETP